MIQLGVLAAFLAITALTIPNVPVSAQERIALRAGNHSMGFQIETTATAIVDVTGDGRLDVVMPAVDRTQNNTVLIVARQTSDGSFVVEQSLPMHAAFNGPPMRVAVGDLDGDGDDDGVATIGTGLDVAWSDGMSLKAPEEHALVGATHVEVAQLDADAPIEMLVTTQGSTDELHRLDRDGASWTDTTLTTAPTLGQPRVADLEPDGDIDIMVVTGTGARVLRWVGGDFTSNDIGGGMSVSSLAIDDLDGDRDADMVLGSPDRLRIYRGDGTGGFGSASASDVSAWGSLIGDLDGDGLLDVLAWQPGSGYRQLTFLRGKVGGGLSAGCPIAWSHVAGVTTEAGSLGDVDGDARPDLVMPAGQFGLDVQRHADSVATRMGRPTFFPTEQPFGSDVLLEGSFAVDAACPPPAPGQFSFDLVQTYDGQERVLATAQQPDSFSYRVYLRRTSVLGPADFEVRFSGDGFYEPASSGPVTVTFVPGPGQVSLKVEPLRANYRKVVSIQATLASASVSNNHTLTIRHRIRSQPWIERNVEVDPQTGKVNLEMQVTEKTTIEAIWEGDENFPISTDSEIVQTRAKVTGRLLRTSGSDGSAKVYRFGRNVYFGTVVHPNHAPDRVQIRIGRRVDGRWRLWFTRSFKLNEESSLLVYLPTTVLDVGTRYRMDAYFSGDDRNLRDTSGWKEFKVVSSRLVSPRSGSAAMGLRRLDRSP